MANSAIELPGGEKLTHLESVLASRTFERCDQLKRLLRYVCEMEIAGRGAEVTEYSIGVEALGRPKDFTPSEDSSVRNRAFALRKKLEEYYSQESPDAPLRIELPKGSYLPRFVASPDAAAAPAVSPPRRVVVVWPLAAALTVGLLGGGLGVWVWSRAQRIPAVPEAVQGAWGGMIHPGSRILLSMATPAQSFIREFPVPYPPSGTYRPVTPEIEEWYHRMRPNRGNAPTYLFQVTTFNSPLWGDAAGAFRVAQMLRGYGVEAELLAERLVTPPFFRDRNVVMLGNAEYSPIIERLVRNLPLQIGFNPAIGNHDVYEVDPGGTVLRRFTAKREAGEMSEVLGLISSIPAEGGDEQHARYLILSGFNSAGNEAAAEYITSRSQLEDLARRLGVKPGGVWPAKFQVLVRASSNRTVALSVGYETHRIVR